MDQEIHCAIGRRVDRRDLLVDRSDDKQCEGNHAEDHHGGHKPRATRAGKIGGKRRDSSCNRQARLHDRSARIHRRKETRGPLPSRFKSGGMLRQGDVSRRSKENAAAECCENFSELSRGIHRSPYSICDWSECQTLERDNQIKPATATLPKQSYPPSFIAFGRARRRST